MDAHRAQRELRRLTTRPTKRGTVRESLHESPASKVSPNAKHSAQTKDTGEKLFCLGVTPSAGIMNLRSRSVAYSASHRAIFLNRVERAQVNGVFQQASFVCAMRFRIAKHSAL